jgi:hypothetical protein
MSDFNRFRKTAKKLHKLRMSESKMAEKYYAIARVIAETENLGPSATAVALFAAAFYVLDTQVMSRSEVGDDEAFNAKVDMYIAEAAEVYEDYMFEREQPTVEDVHRHLAQAEEPKNHLN